MPIEVAYVPPKINAVAAINATAEATAEAGANVLLEAAKPRVPVEYGVLRDSGRVVPGEGHAAVTFGKDDDGSEKTPKHAPSNQYAVIVHEDTDANHPNGGSDHFLSDPMDSEHPAILAALAEALRAVLK